MNTPQKYLADMESDLAKKQKECKELEKHIHAFRALMKERATAVKTAAKPKAKTTKPARKGQTKK